MLISLDHGQDLPSRYSMARRAGFAHFFEHTFSVFPGTVLRARCCPEDPRSIRGDVFMHRYLAVLVLILLLGTTVSTAAQPASCPNPNLGNFDERELKALNQKQSDLKLRATASDNHNKWIEVLEAELATIPNLAVRSVQAEIRRWQARRTVLQVNGADVSPVTPAPSTKATGASGATGELLNLPTGRFSNNSRANGRIVVRKMQRAPLFDNELGATLEDLDDAEAARAKGLIYLSDLQDRQLEGLYIPYQGREGSVPVVYVGRAASKRVTDAMTQPGRKATISIEADITERAPTRALVATIKGAGPERIVVESHTDGVNAIWDNGPVAMLAMARYLAQLPDECRKKQVEFYFVTGHLHQSINKANDRYFAKQLDEEYVTRPSVVVVIEHLGARQYKMNSNGVLELNGANDSLFVATSHSTKLTSAARQAFFGVPGTVFWEGWPAPKNPPGELKVLPPHCSFGGEGTSYNQHLLPTVGAIAIPRSLFLPPFGMDAIDFKLMRQQTLAFTTLLRRIDQMSQDDIAGEVKEYRFLRDQGKAASCPEHGSHQHSVRIAP